MKKLLFGDQEVKVGDPITLKDKSEGVISEILPQIGKIIVHAHGYGVPVNPQHYGMLWHGEDDSLTELLDATTRTGHAHLDAWEASTDRLAVLMERAQKIVDDYDNGRLQPGVDAAEPAIALLRELL